jgi:flagellar protein FliO/FliZ
MTSVRALAAFACAGAAMHAGAQSAAESPPAMDLAPGLLQTTLGLALVLALIFGAAWLLRRLTPAGRSGTLIKVVATQSVGQRERVVLIEVGDQWLLLGVAPGAVRTLQTLPKGTIAVPGVEHPFARLLAAARSARAR